MPLISKENRELWLLLLQTGEAWTVAEIAAVTKGNSARVFEQITSMAANGHVEKFPPQPGMRRLRYAVTGTCVVPLGMRLAEVQA